MIRIILVAVFVTLFLILSIPLMIAEWIIGKFNMELKNRSSLAIVNWAFHMVIFFAGTKVITIGKENVPTDTAVLYVGNHQSYFDIVLNYPHVARPTGFIAKKEMEKIPLLTVWMRNLHCLFLDRDNIKEGLKTILTGIEKAKSGISIFIFPEGTRNHTPDTLLPFHEGSFKIAEKAGIPIIPVTTNNSAQILEAHAPYVRKATVTIEYGKPIYLKDLPKEEKKFVGATVQKIIADTYAKNKELYFSKN